MAANMQEKGLRIVNKTNSEGFYPPPNKQESTKETDRSLSVTTVAILYTIFLAIGIACLILVHQPYLAGMVSSFLLQFIIDHLF